MNQAKGALRRPALLAMVMLGTTMLLGVWGQRSARGQDDTAKPERKPKLAPQQYKNIKVLTELPANQLINTMQSWNAALGVKCDFCHVVSETGTGWEKDDNPHKLVARDMVLLTRDMNSRHASLKNQATCYMCHHGQAEPEIKAAAPKPPQGGAAQVK
jgi:hypothetical protein